MGCTEYFITTQVENVLQQEVILTRQLVASGKSDRALVVLRKKRLQQARLKDLDSWLLKVEQMVSMMDLAYIQGICSHIMIARKIIILGAYCC